MIITEDLKKCVTNRAAELAVKKFSHYGELDLTACVEQATEECKIALDSYMDIMRTMSVKMEGTKTLSDLLPKEETAL